MRTNCRTYVCLTRLRIKLNMTSTQPITMRLLLASSLLLHHLLPMAKSQLPKPASATQSFTSAHPSAAVGQSPCAVWGGSVDGTAAPYAGPWATVSTPPLTPRGPGSAPPLQEAVSHICSTLALLFHILYASLAPLTDFLICTHLRLTLCCKALQTLTATVPCIYQTENITT